MSDLPFTIYSVKTEDLFWLMPFEGITDCDEKSPTEKYIWFESLQKKLNKESDGLSETYDDLLKSNVENPYDLEVSTIMELWKKTFEQYTRFLLKIETEKYKKLLEERSNLKKEQVVFYMSRIFVTLKRMVTFHHLVNKHSKALIDDLKTVATIQPSTVKKQAISKLSDISAFLKQFELSKDFRDMEEKALKTNVRITTDLLSVLETVCKTYFSQLKQLMYEQESILELFGNVRIYPPKEKVCVDFMKFIDVAQNLLLNNSEENLLLEDNKFTMTAEEIVMDFKKNIKLYRSLWRKHISFYKTFLQFTD